MGDAVSPAIVPPLLARWLIDHGRTLVVQSSLMGVPGVPPRRCWAALDRDAEAWGIYGGSPAVLLASRVLRAWVEDRAARGLPEAIHPSASHLIDLSGAYLPGAPVPSWLVLLDPPGAPRRKTLRVLRCLRGEPQQPERPEDGVVWRSILERWDSPGADEWVACADSARTAEAVALAWMWSGA